MLLTTIFTADMMAQDITGTWKGKLDVQGTELPLVLHLDKGADGLTATMDSPAQGAMGIEVNKVSFADNTLNFGIAQIGASYTGTLEGTEKIVGEFSQGGMSLPLTLEKGEVELPGNTGLPSSESSLEELASFENRDHAYSVEDYFARPKARSFQLSPDGKYMSYREKDENAKNHVYVKNIATGEVNQAIVEGEELIRGFGWANNSRLVYVMDTGGNENYHLFAVDLDGKNLKELTPFDGVRVEILANLKEDKDHMIISMNKNNPEVFEPYKINIVSGALEQIYENDDPQNPISDYTFDKDGELRGFARLKDGVNFLAYYAKTPGKFELVKELNWKDTFGVISFDYSTPNKHDAYVMSNLESDKTTLYRYDMAKGEVIEELFSHEKYDAGGLSLSRNRNWELDYFSYEGEKQELIPVSDYYKKLHSKITKKFPDYQYSIADVTDDESKYLIFVQSDKLYGQYYSYDVADGEIELLYDLMPQLKQEDMAEMRPITFQSRDGLTLHGYITLPKEAIEGKQVPLIVNPHGGPQGIRDSWGFNPETQLFASRGYATLQVNFRISGGYGREFLESGFKQIGRACMDDVEDGLAYVIEQGWVDKDMVAIYGGSHGGYAVLRGLTKTPDLYAAGVDYVGVSNLYTFMETIPPYWKPYLDIIKEIWYDKDVPEEKVIMDEVSPVFHIDKIKKPLLVVQGANDPRVNIDESDQIVEALRARGVDVPYIVEYDEGHGFAKEENSVAMYKAMMGFYAKHLKQSKVSN